ncbi:MAG: hypothetical protein ACFFEE_06860 [Candidatus Thorarchaeota archaeon]
MTSGIIQTIMEILRQSKEDNVVSNDLKLDSEVLFQLGLPTSLPFMIYRRQRIDIAMEAINNGANVSEIVDLMTWKDFEGFVAGILSENNYRCVESFRRRGNSLIQGMEIDVVGVRGQIIIAVDAKMWGIRSGKISALKTAAEKQKERTLELTTEFERLSKKLITLREGLYTIYPLIVTWLVEEVELHEGVPIVPVFKLNSFILDFHQYEDIIVHYVGEMKGRIN